jgi:hypothetical protein
VGCGCDFQSIPDRIFKMATDASDIEIFHRPEAAITHVTQLQRHFIGAFVVDLSTAETETAPYQRQLDLNHVKTIQSSLLKHGILHPQVNILDAILYTPVDPSTSTEILQNIKIGVFNGQHRVAAVKAACADRSFPGDPKWGMNLYRPSTYTTE